MSIQHLKSQNPLTQDQKDLLSRLQPRLKALNGCANFAQNTDAFVNFYSNVSLLVKNVQQNLQVLDQYRKFPGQLSKWISAINMYL